MSTDPKQKKILRLTSDTSLRNVKMQKITKNCDRFFIGHYRKTPHQTLSEIINKMSPKVTADIYGTGQHMEAFEKKMSSLLGKESAVFMPSGTMAQPIVLRIWSERKNIQSFGFHPKSHLELHEHKAYQFLHNLKGVYLGNPNKLINIDDLEKLQVPIATLLIELPQREIGGQLPNWQDLKNITNWAKEKNIAVHLDGARLWECRPFYQKEYSEICSLFDSVYVSFYKGLGGIAGAVLAGQRDLIQEAKIWKRRHGGDLIHLYPYILSAEQSLAERLPLMTKYHEKAVAIAEVLNKINGIEIIPKKPATNMMHIYLKGKADTLQKKALQLAKETKICLFNKLSPSELPNYCKFELSVGDATLDVTEEEVFNIFTKLVDF